MVEWWEGTRLAAMTGFGGRACVLHVCACVCMCVHVCGICVVCVWYACVYVYMCICVYVYVCMCVCVFVCLCAYRWCARVCIPTHKHHTNPIKWF